MITEQQQSMIDQLRQVFLTLVDQANDHCFAEAINDEADGDTQQQNATVATICSALQRVSTAFVRETAAYESDSRRAQAVTAEWRHRSYSHIFASFDS